MRKQILTASICGNCKNDSWEAYAEKVELASEKFLFVRCTKCYVAAGVLPYFDAATITLDVLKQIRSLEARLLKELKK